MVEMVDAAESPGVAESRRELRVTALPENVVEVRRALDGLDLPAGLLDDAKLLATELVTNSIRHAGLRPDETIHFTAERRPGVLRVTVRDHTEERGPAPVAGSIRPAPGAESGWGLYLMDRIAQRWGTSLRGGSSYWFELEIPDPPGPD